MQLDMEWEIVTSGNRVLENTTWLGVRTSGMKVSGGFWAAAKIDELGIQHVQVMRSNKYHAALFNFLTPEEIDTIRLTNPLLTGIYLLHADGGGKSRKRVGSGGLVQTGSFIRNTPWLWSIASQKTHGAKRFIPRKGTHDREWIVSFVPGFINDSTVEDCNARPGVSGIYCLKNDSGDVVYIGQGEVVGRLRRHIYDDHIRPTSIAWTQIDDASVRQNAEDYHLHAHQTKYGRLPLFNIRGGRRPKDSDG